ncbi:hydroxylase [Streptomyces sp. NPDC002643]
MAHEVLDRITAVGPQLAELADKNEKLGRLSDETVALLQSTGMLRMLQPTKFGGLAAHPREFAEAVMAVARHDGAAGWVGGVVGIHAWELAQMDARLQQEIWGENPDTWIGSPYIPNGIAEPVDGGYVLNGRWPFSSGSDHCDWTFLGAMVGNGKGKPAMPPTVLHVVLPRPDYEIVDGTWDVIGLSGTGSKDVVVKDAFIPAYRTVEIGEVMSGQAAERNGADETLYKLPFTAAFPTGITASVIGICEGALDTHLALQRDRVSVMGVQVRDDPYTMYAAGEAAAEIAASRLQLLDSVSRLYDLVDAGRPVTVDIRAAIRRDQVRSAWRAVTALDGIFARSGGNIVRRDNPLQRLWRDAHVGLQHAVHVPGMTYHSGALTQMGLELPEPMRVML